MKKIYKVFLIIGLSLLGVLIIASFVCLLLSVFGVIYILEVSASIFVASVSSVLTIVALIITAQSNEKLYNLQFQKMDSDKQRCLNAINNTLILDKVALGRCLQPKNITLLNKCTNIYDKNLPITLIFNTQYLEAISKIAIIKFELIFIHSTLNNHTIRIEIGEENINFLQINRKGANCFAINLITNINKDTYHFLLNAIDNGGIPQFNLYVELEFLTTDNARDDFVDKSKYCFDGVTDRKKLFIFNKI